MDCVLPRTVRETDFGTLCLLSCLWMTAPTRYTLILVWPLQRQQWALLCNCLVGALPYSHDAMRSFPSCGLRVFHPAQYCLGRGGCTQFVHGRSRMTIDPRTPTMPGRSMSGFHQPGRHYLHQARSAVRCSARGEGEECHSRPPKRTSIREAIGSALKN